MLRFYETRFNLAHAPKSEFAFQSRHYAAKLKNNNKIGAPVATGCRPIFPASNRGDGRHYWRPFLVLEYPLSISAAANESKDLKTYTQLPI